MRAYVGVTDGDWSRHLAAIRADEVNFWRPSGGRAFHALGIGEPFFFKSHAHEGNRVVGGGFYSGFAALRVSEAWRFFGKETLPAPPDWAPNIVQGRGFDIDQPAVQPYFDLLIARLLLDSQVTLDASWHRPGPMFGDPRLVRQRLGQRSFQGVVLNAYSGQCAVTGDKIRPVLQAAHIRPVTEGGEHRLDNGLLLRSDVHTLFDAGYLGVDQNYRLLVSPRLRKEFGNGEEFYVRAASRDPIVVPTRRADRPNREFLEWHVDTKFRAS